MNPINPFHNWREGEAVGEGGGGTPAAPWYQPAESLKTSDPEIWSSLEKRPEKDFPTFIKSAISLEKKMGSALTPPGKDAKPEEQAAFKGKLREMGYLKTAPDSPDKYEIKAPEGWGEMKKETVGKVQSIAHKHEISQEALNELTGVYFEEHKEIPAMVAQLKEILPQLKLNKEEQQKAWETKLREEGRNPESIKAGIARYAAKRFSPLDIQGMGDYGNSPIVMTLLYENAQANGEEFPDIMPSGGTAVDAEYDDIQKTMKDPQHADHKLWLTSDPAWVAKRDAAYKRKWGTKEV